MKTDISELMKKYKIQSKEEFKKYENKAKLLLTTGKRPNNNRILIIVGGQPGAGKTRLVKIAEEELMNDAVVVDVVELMALHPSYSEVTRKYPEFAYRILSSDAYKLEEKMLEYLKENGYAVIYEGTLRVTEKFLKIAKNFKESSYRGKMKILAVPKLKSYGATFERYAAALLANTLPRWVEKYGHDDSYDGVITTTQELVRKSLVDDISVYTRGENLPYRIYSTKERQFPNAIEAIKHGREIGRKKAVEEFEDEYTFVRDILSEQQPELLSKLDDWLQLYKQEKQCFSSLEVTIGE